MNKTEDSSPAGLLIPGFSLLTLSLLTIPEGCDASHGGAFDSWAVLAYIVA